MFACLAEARGPSRRPDPCARERCAEFGCRLLVLRPILNQPPERHAGRAREAERAATRVREASLNHLPHRKKQRAWSPRLQAFDDLRDAALVEVDRVESAGRSCPGLSARVARNSLFFRSS